MKIQNIFAALAVCVGLAGPATALSCLQPDVARSFNDRNALPDKFVVATGVLTFDEKKLPFTDWDNQQLTPESTRIRARFTGKSLSSSGFDTPFDHAITLNALCYGPWCVHAKSGETVLAFLKIENNSYELALDPCYTNGFVDPSPAMLKKVRACMQGKSCKPEFD